MLAEKVIFYDDSCPMCQLYTAGFVRAGVLPREGRVAFGQAASQCPEAFGKLDTERARLAIPLVDRTTGEVAYGLDALFLLIGHGFPALRPLFRGHVLKALLTPLYRLISYNRRQLAGCRPPVAGFDCRPAFHTGWRALWLGIALTVWAVRSAAFPFPLFGLQLIGLAVFLLRGWDALGSYATNLLLFALLLPLGWPVALGIALLDLLRRSWVLVQ